MVREGEDAVKKPLLEASLGFVYAALLMGL